MSALKEFANFITLNVANLAATYERLLIENGENYQTLPADSRIAFARKLIKTVAEACESETSAPLCRLFEERVNQNPPEPRNDELSQPFLEVECLGQTLITVVTNLEASKFLWQMLSEVRATILRALESSPSSPSNPPMNGDDKGVNKSIPQGNQMEQVLRESEERFRQVISSISDHIYVTEVTEEGRFVNLYLSPHIEALTGYPYEKFIADWSFWPAVVIHPDDRAAAAEQAAQLAKGQNSSGEYRLIRANGDVIWVRDSGQAKKDATQPGITIYGVVSDITERKRTEQALRESEERTRLIVDTALDAVITIGHTGLVMDWNTQAETTFGWSRQEVVGRRLSDTIIPPQYRAAHERGLEHFLATGEGPVLNKRIEITALHSDGHEFPIELTITPFRVEETFIFSAYLRDITQRRQTEEVLRQERAKLELERTRLRTALDILPFGLWFVDADGEILLQSAASKEIWAEDVLSADAPREYKGWWANTGERIAPEKWPRVRALTHSEASMNKEIIIEAFDGRRKTMLSSAVPLKDETGAVIGAIVLNMDITERKQAEEALAQERNVLRTLIDTLPDYIYAKDTESRFIIGNIALARVMGASTPEHLIGKTDFDFYPQELAEQYYVDEQEVIQSGQPLLNREEPNIDPAGNRHWLSTTKVPLRDSHGKIVGLVGTGRNITERKQVEETLWLTQFTVDRASADIVWLGPDAQFLYVNDAACRTLGYSREELLSMTIHDIQADPISAEVWPAHWQELKQRISFTFETQHRRKNGQIFPVEVTVNYIEFGGKEYNCASMADITERKRLEQQIRGSLERRARQVQTSTEVAQQISTAAVLDELFRRVVNLVQAQFGYYHVQVYTLVEGDLVLQEGTGEAGRRMREAGHKIALTDEQSLVVRAIRSGEPVLVPNTSQEPSWLPNQLLPETKAELAVPISLGAEVLGVLDVQSDTRAGLNEEDQLLLIGLCGQIAVAIDNRRIDTERERLVVETEVRLQEIQAMQQISQNLAKTLQAKEILDIFFQACTQVAGFEYVQLSLVDKEQNRIKGIGGVGVTESNIKKANRDLDEPDLLADIIRTGQTEILTGWDERLDRAIFEAEGHANWVRVFLPVRLRQENIGVVESGFNKNTRANIEDFQLRLLRAFIDQTALALDNAQRYEASQKAGRREQTIREITERMRAATSLQELAKTTASELGQRLSAGHTLVELGIETDWNGQG